jgi:predicted metal-dependent HD superfamily phosphohydrolase
MEDQGTILDKAARYASEILLSLPETMVYHNLQHTREVVESVREIGTHSNLSNDQLEIALLAAWFHDTGFSRSADRHEEASKDIAAGFLRDSGYPEDRIEQVLGCIDATRAHSTPSGTLESVLVDADYAHLAQKSYFDKMLLLRKERQLVSGIEEIDEDWNQENLKFLRKHDYHTEYGKTVLTPKLQKNIQKQSKIIKKLQQKADLALEKNLNVDPQKLKELQKKLKKVEGRPDRGIETMFRLTSRNHLELSAMADSKANILISVNAIIISVLIGGLISSMSHFSNLIVPTYVLLGVNVITIIFAILSTRPNVSKGKFTKEDIKQKKTNLLFFGNFHKMSREEYKWGMLEMMNSADYLYSSLIDDIYFLGQVLGKKYRFLHIAYTVFMIGIILSVVVYVLYNMRYFQDFWL